MTITQLVGKWVLVRTDQGGGYVAVPGSTSSYTRNILNARVFDSEQEARDNSCPGNETPLKVN